MRVSNYVLRNLSRPTASAFALSCPELVCFGNMRIVLQLNMAAEPSDHGLDGFSARDVKTCATPSHAKASFTTTVKHHSEHNISAEMMQLLCEALDLFDEPSCEDVAQKQRKLPSYSSPTANSPYTSSVISDTHRTRNCESTMHNRVCPTHSLHVVQANASEPSVQPNINLLDVHMMPSEPCVKPHVSLLDEPERLIASEPQVEPMGGLLDASMKPTELRVEHNGDRQLNKQEPLALSAIDEPMKPTALGASNHSTAEVESEQCWQRPQPDVSNHSTREVESEQRWPRPHPGTSDHSTAEVESEQRWQRPQSDASNHSTMEVESDQRWQRPPSGTSGHSTAAVTYSELTWLANLDKTQCAVLCAQCAVPYPMWRASVHTGVLCWLSRAGARLRAMERATPELRPSARSPDMHIVVALHVEACQRQKSLELASSARPPGDVQFDTATIVLLLDGPARVMVDCALQRVNVMQAPPVAALVAKFESMALRFLQPYEIARLSSSELYGLGPRRRGTRWGGDSSLHSLKSSRATASTHGVQRAVALHGSIQHNAAQLGDTSNSPLADGSQHGSTQRNSSLLGASQLGSSLLGVMQGIGTQLSTTWLNSLLLDMIQRDGWQQGNGSLLNALWCNSSLLGASRHDSSLLDIMQLDGSQVGVMQREGSLSGT